MKKAITILKKESIGRRDYAFIIGIFILLEAVVFGIIFSLIGVISDDTWLPIFGITAFISLIALIWINMKRMKDAGRNTSELFLYFVIPLFFAAHSIFLIFYSNKRNNRKTLKDLLP